MPSRRASLCLGITLLLTSLPSYSQVPPSHKVSTELECPHVLAVAVLAKKYKDWSIYSNDPLRLTGADIALIIDHEDALLDPNETKQLNDKNLSIVQIFRLAQNCNVKKPILVCHYGVHAQLSQVVPVGTDECKVVHHRRFGPEEFEFEASCR